MNLYDLSDEVWALSGDLLDPKSLYTLYSIGNAALGRRIRRIIRELRVCHTCSLIDTASIFHLYSALPLLESLHLKSQFPYQQCLWIPALSLVMPSLWKLKFNFHNCIAATLALGQLSDVLPCLEVLELAEGPPLHSGTRGGRRIRLSTIPRSVYKLKICSIDHTVFVEGFAKLPKQITYLRLECQIREGLFDLTSNISYHLSDLPLHVVHLENVHPSPSIDLRRIKLPEDLYECTVINHGINVNRSPLDPLTTVRLDLDTYNGTITFATDAYGQFDRIRLRSPLSCDEFDRTSILSTFLFTYPQEIRNGYYLSTLITAMEVEPTAGLGDAAGIRLYMGPHTIAFGPSSAASLFRFAVSSLSIDASIDKEFVCRLPQTLKVLRSGFINEAAWEAMSPNPTYCTHYDYSRRPEMAPSLRGDGRFILLPNLETLATRDCFPPSFLLVPPSVTNLSCLSDSWIPKAFDLGGLSKLTQLCSLQLSHPSLPLSLMALLPRGLKELRLETNHGAPLEPQHVQALPPNLILLDIRLRHKRKHWAGVVDLAIASSMPRHLMFLRCHLKQPELESIDEKASLFEAFAQALPTQLSVLDVDKFINTLYFCSPPPPRSVK